MRAIADPHLQTLARLETSLLDWRFDDAFSALRPNHHSRRTGHAARSLLRRRRIDICR